MPCSGHAGLTRVLAIRHGETAWNVDARIQGHLDIDLNDTGRRQALQLARALAEGDRPEAIYSSDLSRARETARAISRLCDLPLQLEVGLRERCFGQFQGHTVEEVRALAPEKAERWRQRDPDFVPPEGESLTTFSARCVGTVLRLAALHPGQTVAVVAHGGVLDCLYRAATGLSLQAPRTWTIDNASVNRLLFSDGRLTLAGWGDVGHLAVCDAGLDDAADAVM